MSDTIPEWAVPVEEPTVGADIKTGDNKDDSTLLMVRVDEWFKQRDQIIADLTQRKKHLQEELKKCEERLRLLGVEVGEDVPLGMAPGDMGATTGRTNCSGVEPVGERQSSLYDVHDDDWDDGGDSDDEDDEPAHKPKPPKKPYGSLSVKTRREMLKILQTNAKALTVEAIAARMGIGVASVKVYLQLLKKDGQVTQVGKGRAFWKAT